MKAKFSASWVSSSQTRKQRKYRYNAPLHLRRKMTAAHLAKALRRQYGVRALPVRKGDEVVVARGEFRRMRSKVISVDLKTMKVELDGIKRKKKKGEEVQVPFDPSNLVVTKLDDTDKRRMKFLERKKTAKPGVEK